MTDETCCGACGYPIHATKDRACDWCRQTADRIEALTAELAKAVEGLREIAGECGCSTARATLAEIEGGKG
jgi:hypothetical protein